MNIKRRLSELGWNQQALVDRLAELKSGVSQQNVQAIISRDSAKSKHLSAIARALYLLPDQLLTGDWPVLQPGQEPASTMLAARDLPAEFKGDKYLKKVLAEWGGLVETQKKEIVDEVMARVHATRVIARQVHKKPNTLNDKDTRTRFKLESTEKSAKAPARRHRTKR